MEQSKRLIFLHKKEGETPLEALEFFRGKHKKYKDIKMTYAGRLDPMASGLLLVLAGEETKNKQKYLNLGKAYEFEILFGFASDSYDILGKVLKVSNQTPTEKEIKKNIKYFTGKFKQKYPLYSSRTWEKARQDILVKPIEREVSVSSLKFFGLKKINKKKLLENIERRIRKVKGDFRQKEILKIWRSKLGLRASKTFLVGSFKIKCGSGTYVRAIANDLGEKMGIPALAFKIKRTKIGSWLLSKNIKG